MTTLASLRRQLEQARTSMPTAPEGPPAPVIPPADGGPPPRGCRCMTSEEVAAEVARLRSGEWRPPALTKAQRAELDVRFERIGGVKRVERMQREFLAGGQP